MIKSEKLLKLQIEFKKVLHCVPVFNDTFVILAIKSHGVQCIAHINIDGKIISEKQYKNCNLNPLVVLSEKEVVFVNSSQKQIVHWDLQTHKFMRIKVDFNELSVSQKLFVFPFTSIFCLCQFGDQNSNYFKLTYFPYPTDKNIKPIDIFDSKCNENIWNYDYTIERGNSKSMVIWFKDCHKQRLQFKTYDMKQKKMAHYEIQNNLIQPKVELHINNIWQSRENQFTLCALTDQQKIIIQGENQTKQIFPHSVFVCNIKEKSLRETKYRFPGKYEVQIINVIPFGQNVMFRTFDFLNNFQVGKSPVYYVNNQSEQIIEEDFWKCSYLSKYELPGYDGDLVVEAQYQNANVKQIKFISTKLINIKQAIAMFLNSIIGQNCDQALVETVVFMIRD